MNRLIELVVRRIGLDVADQLQANARKVKFIVSEMPPDSAFPVKFTDFEVRKDKFNIGESKRGERRLLLFRIHVEAILKMYDRIETHGTSSTQS